MGWPRLREELALYPGPRLADGQPSWVLHDPVRNLFFRLDWLTFECLSHWSLADPEQGLRARVIVQPFDWGNDRPPATPWEETILYEIHVRGATQRHPGVPEHLRGTYAGLASPAMLAHLKTTRK